MTMNSLRLMPALPFTLAYVAGTILMCIKGDIPVIFYPIFFVLISSATFLLRKNEKLRGIPLVFATFVVGMGMMHIKQMTYSEGDTVLNESFIQKTRYLRSSILENIQQEGVGGKDYAIVSAMAFGDKSALDAEMRNEYSVTGASHLLALSGMHLGILFVLLSLIFAPLKLIGKALTLTAIWTYVVLVGMPASVVRAATMLTIYSICTIDGRAKMSVNALCVTAWIMLVVNPMQLWDIGFQLSFSALLAIFVFTTPIINIIPRAWLFEHPLLRKVWSMIAVSCAAQLGTAPLVAFYFQRFSCYFLLTNIVAIPLVTILLYAVCLSLFTWYVPFLRVFFLKVVVLSSRLLNGFIGIVASWSGASIENISINWIQLMLIYGMITVLAVLVRYFYSTLK